MKVVLDTNILIPAIFWRGSPYKVLRLGLDKGYSLILSEEILHELEEKLKEKFGLPDDVAKKEIEILRAYGKIIRPKEKVDVVKEDPKDNKFLECALSCRAHYIVSGDGHLLRIKEHRGIKIISAREFLELLQEKSARHRGGRISAGGGK